VLAAVGASTCIAALLLPSLALIRPSPANARTVGRGATLWRAGQATVLVLDGARASPDRLMSALQLAAVRDLDVLVASRPGSNEAGVAEQVQRRFPAAVVLAPPRSRLPGALVPPAGSDLRVGDLVIHVEYGDDRLAVTVGRAGGRDPPG
jgi:beta-lactamase superfamily II metal-dependent hydrolase